MVGVLGRERVKGHHPRHDNGIKNMEPDLSFPCGPVVLILLGVAIFGGFWLFAATKVAW